MTRYGFRVNPLALLDVASQSFLEKILNVEQSAWDASSTCAEWTVRDVNDHVAGGNRFSVACLAGSSFEHAFAAALNDGFDGDPIEMFSFSAESQLRAFSEPDALKVTVNHPMGQITGLTFLGYRICDLALHAWDIARSTDTDEQIDDRVVEFVANHFADGSSGVFSSGSYGPAHHVVGDRPLSQWDQVLITSGRTP